MLILSRVKSWSKLKAWGLKILKKHGKKKAGNHFTSDVGHESILPSRRA